MLVLLFGTFLQPITILFSLPLSIGGAIAADVHGKNHHRDGGFGDHVIALRLMLPNGVFGTFLQPVSYTHLDVYKRPVAIQPTPAPGNPPSLADDPTIKSLSDRLDKNPDDAAALYRRGQVYASKGAYDLAVKDFTNSLRLNPKDVEAYNNRCWVRTVIGDLPAALKDCNEALRLRPNFVDALDSRGLMNLKGGQNKNAIADFDAALNINPRLTSSLYGRGLAKKRNGAIAEGDLDIANAKAMDPNIVKEFADYGVQ